MDSKDRDYYRRRVAQENAAAESTSCAHARLVHADLAERYSAKLRLAEALATESSISEPRLEATPARRRVLR